MRNMYLKNKVYKVFQILKKNKYNFQYFPFVLIAILLYSYVLIKAARISFTYDESSTFINYVDGSFIKIFDFTVANNHLLNSIIYFN
jgi:hypothetical protein